MALLFAEDGIHVNLSDPSEEAMDAVIEKAEKAGYNGKINKHTGTDQSSFVQLHALITSHRLRFALQITVGTTATGLLSATWRRWRQGPRRFYA